MAKVEKKRALSEERLRDFLREMLLIRRFEEKVEERFRAGELPGFLHVAIGQEAAEVGVCAAMEDGDVFGSTHRAHGHTLARGTHPNALMAELYGKIEGCSHGYGGSMHLYDVERGNLGANAVVGGGLPSLVGAGPRLQAARRAARRGRVLRRRRDEHRHLPRVAQPRAALEDEDALRLREQRVGRVDARLAALAGLGRHVQARARLRHALDQGRRPGRRGGLREGDARRSSTCAPARGPVFLDVETYRMHGHYIGDPQVYRSKEDRDEAAERDPIVRLREKLEVSAEEWQQLEDEVHEIVEGAVEFAKNGTDPQPEDALKNIYA